MYIRPVIFEKNVKTAPLQFRKNDVIMPMAALITRKGQLQQSFTKLFENKVFKLTNGC